MQQKSAILLEEFSEQREQLDIEKTLRKDRLQAVKQNISFLSNLPSIDQAETFLDSLSAAAAQVSHRHLILFRLLMIAGQLMLVIVNSLLL
jgi:hypothetical protein